MRREISNYNIFLLSNALLSIATGLFGPFFILFVRDFGGGIQRFGFAVGLMVVTGAITSYLAGKYSDRLGRKKFLLVGGYSLAIVILAYTIIGSLWQLYVLQVLNGMMTSMLLTMEVSFLGDVTSKANRGANIGKYHAILGIIGGLVMMASGFLVNLTHLKIIFYLVGGIMVISTTILWLIKAK